MKTFLLGSLMVGVSGCATMNESLQLGAGMGAIGGGAATAIAYSSTGKSPSFGNVAIGAGIGLALGALTSYITHKQVEKDRMGLYGDQTEMHFGDLPPSPFMIPKMTKKGAR